MPRFTLTSPEGQTYDIDGPDGATPDQAFQMLQAHLKSQPAQKPVAAPAAPLPQPTEVPEPSTLGIVGDAALNTAKEVGQILPRAGEKIGKGAIALGETVGRALRPTPEQIAHESVTGETPADIRKKKMQAAIDMAAGVRAPIRDDEATRQMLAQRQQEIVQAERIKYANREQDPLKTTHAYESQMKTEQPVSTAADIVSTAAPFLVGGPVTAAEMASMSALRLAGTVAIRNAGPVAGAVGTSGARAEDVVNQGGTPQQALAAAGQQGALDAAGGAFLHGATAPLLRVAPKLGIPVGAATGTAYQLAQSGITQQYNPEQASEERGLKPLLLAAGLGATPATFHSAARYSAREPIPQGPTGAQLQAQADQVQRVREQTLADVDAATKMQTPAARAAEDLMQQTTPAQASEAVTRFRNPVEDVPMVAGGTKPVLEPLVRPQSGTSKPPVSPKVEPTERPDLYLGTTRPSGQSAPPRSAPVEPTEVPNAYGFTRQSGVSRPPETGKVVEAGPSERYGISTPSQGLPKGSRERELPGGKSEAWETNNPYYLEKSAPAPAIEGLELPASAREVVNKANLTPDELTTLKQKLGGWDAHADPEGAAGNVQQVIQNIRDRANKSRQGSTNIPGEIADRVKGAVEWAATGKIPEYLRRAEEASAGASNESAYKLRQADVRLKNAMKQGKFTSEEVLASLRGEPSRVPVAVVKELREHIDSLSKRAVDENLVDDSHKQVLTANMGKYLNESYKAHDPELGPWWEKNIPDATKAAAIKHFVSQGMTPTEAVGKVNQTLKSYATETPAIRSGSKQGPQKPGNLVAREEMTPEYRALLGPIEDARLASGRSATKLSKLVHERAFAKNVIKEGLGKDFFPNAEHRNGVDYTHEVTMPDGESYFTTKEIHDWLVNQGGSRRGALADTWAKANAASKIALTAGNVGGFAVTNMVGNSLIAAANLHIPGLTGSLDGLKGIAKAGKAMVGDRVSEPYLANLYKLGVIDHGVSRQEVSAGIERAVKSNPVKNAAGAGVRGVLHLAAAWDNVFKINAFEMNKARIKELYPQTAPEAVEKMAANNVRDTYATYGRVFNIIKRANKVPGLTGFASYLAEIPRTTTNTVKIALRDAQQGGARGKALGVARMAALGTAIMAAPTLAAAAKVNANVTDEQDEAFRKTNKYNRFSTLLYYRKEDGSLDAFSLGKYDPYSHLRETFHAAVESGTSPSEALYNAGKQFFGPVAGSPLVQGTTKAAVNVWDEKYKQAAQELGKPFIPGIVGNTWKAMNQQEKDRAAWLFFAAATGVKPVMSDAAKNVTGTSITTHRKEGQDVRDILKTAGPELSDREAGDIAKIRESSTEANRKAVAYARTLGVADADIATALRNSGMHPSQIGELISDSDPIGNDPDVIQQSYLLSKWQEKHAKEMVMASIVPTLKGEQRGEFIKNNEAIIAAGRPALKRYARMQEAIKRMKKAPEKDRGDLLQLLKTMQSE